MVFKHFNIKQKVFGLIAVVLAVIVFIGIYSYQAFTPVAKNWSDYQSQVKERQTLLMSIKEEFGYGGMIHNFKNYVLRGDDKFIGRIDKHFANLNLELTAYAALQGISTIEQEALNAIADVMASYHKNTRVVEQLFKEAKTPSQIDQRVKISDKPALEAFEVLNTEYTALLATYNVKMDAAISDAIAELLIGLVICAMFVTAALTWLYANIMPPLKSLNLTMEDIAEGDGDLSVRLDDSRGDELGNLAGSFNKFISKLESIIVKEKAIIADIATRSDLLSNTAASSTESMNSQQQHTQELASAIEYLSEAIKNVGDNADSASQASAQTDAESNSGKDAVNQSMEEVKKLQARMISVSNIISKLNGASEEIGQVVSVIAGIAEQTNLLALNAAIEAARAGESGRGFAVVADEVRGLAKRTAASLDDIRRMTTQLQSGSQEAVSAITQGQQEVKNSVSIAEGAKDNIEQISFGIGTIHTMNQQIAGVAQEQTQLTQEMTQSIQNVSQMSSSILQDSTSIAEQSQSLAQLSAQLKSLTAQFKVSA